MSTKALILAGGSGQNIQKISQNNFCGLYLELRKFIDTAFSDHK